MSPAGKPAVPLTAGGPILRGLDWIAGSLFRTTLAVLLVALATSLPGLTELPVTDRDEARFAQATKQMLETGDLIDIRFQEEPRWKKPVGIYWLQYVSAELAGTGAASPIWVYRLPSVIAAVLGAVLLAWGARPLVSKRAATLGALMFASTLLLAVEANIAKTDATLTLTAIAAMGGLIHLLFGKGRLRHALVFWIAIALSILIKGPIVPLVVFLAILWHGLLGWEWPRLARLRPGLGLALVAVICLPWLVAIWHVSDGAFFREAIGRDLLGKVAEGQEKHWGPPGLYLGMVWGTFWPWAALLPLAIPALWRARSDRAVIFLTGWVLPFWVILEAVPTKLPHYVLPLYPALALLLAIWAARLAEGQSPRKWQRVTSAVLTALPAAGIAVAIVALPLLLGATVSLPAAGLGLAAAVLAWFAARAAMARMVFRHIGLSLCAALLLYPAALHFGLPGLSPVFASPMVAAQWDRLRACASGPLVSTGYREPSLVFLTGTDTRFIQPTQIAETAAEPGTVILHEGRADAGFPGLEEPEGLIRQSPVLRYFNYNRGKLYEAALFTAPDPRWDACALPATAQ